MEDNEIREKIRKFREIHSEREYRYTCPFRSGSQCLCSICSKIFKMTPPRADEYMSDGYYMRHRYFRSRSLNVAIAKTPCPCSLYGLEYVSKKVDEFMRNGDK